MILLHFVQPLSNIMKTNTSQNCVHSHECDDERAQTKEVDGTCPANVDVWIFFRSKKFGEYRWGRVKNF